MPIENKFPGKDISNDDIKTKFPLCAKNKKNKKTFKINNVLNNIDVKDNKLNIPTLVMIGSQSSGKSSLLNKF